MSRKCRVFELTWPYKGGMIFASVSEMLSADGCSGLKEVNLQILLVKQGKKG